MRFPTVALVVFTFATTGCTLSGVRLTPPVAAAKPKSMTMHGDTRIDDYYWLKERQNPEVIAYLEAENRYASAALAPMKSLKERVYDEIVGRIAEDDTSVPVRDGDWVYYSREEKGKSYEVLCRRPAASVTDIARAAEAASGEQVMLDLNKLAAGHSFFSLSARSVSPNGKILAYAIDTVGRRFVTIRFKNLDTGRVLTDTIADVGANLTWARDNKTLYYTKKDRETLRAYQVFRHVLGADSGQDELVYEETDTTFSVGVGRSTSDRFIIIESDQTLETEVRVIDADDPSATLQLIAPRAGHLYSVDHFRDHFYIVTNWDAVNFRLMRVAPGATDRRRWNEVIAHRDDVLLQRITMFDSHLVVSERHNALRGIRMLPWSDFNDQAELGFSDEVYVAFPTGNPDPTSTTLRYFYSSPTTPSSTYETNLLDGSIRLLKTDAIGGGFESGNYVATREWATARDGTRVPISVVRRRDVPIDGTAPLYIDGYGSYGAASDPWFSASKISLLDRGFVCAIAHVRGGSEMGRQWYESGKLVHKMNTFTDFIDCTKHLVANNYADADHLYAAGGSAGGLLMGAIMNLDPDLYNGIAAAVPFVDVVTTMLDETIPLTTFEYDEWGNPNDESYYHVMKAYSPYDNVREVEYPNLLITTGLHDSQVQYWEPAKWMAKLRTMNVGDNLMVMLTNMTAGHGGASGRYEAIKETAREFAFFAWLAGRPDPVK